MSSFKSTFHPIIEDQCYTALGLDRKNTYMGVSYPPADSVDETEGGSYTVWVSDLEAAYMMYRGLVVRKTWSEPMTVSNRNAETYEAALVGREGELRFWNAATLLPTDKKHVPIGAKRALGNLLEGTRTCSLSSVRPLKGVILAKDGASFWTRRELPDQWKAKGPGMDRDFVFSRVSSTSEVSRVDSVETDQQEKAEAERSAILLQEWIEKFQVLSEKSRWSMFRFSKR